MQRHITQKIPSSIITASLAVLFGIAFVFWADSSISAYLNARGTDPLAMIHVAFPWYFAILIAFVLLCFFYIFRGDGNKLVYVLLVVELSVMLLFTPFLLSGFSRHPDSILSTVVSNNILEVLDGTLPPSAYIYGARYGPRVSTFLRSELGRLENYWDEYFLLLPAVLSDSLLGHHRIAFVLLFLQTPWE